MAKMELLSTKYVVTMIVPVGDRSQAQQVQQVMTQKEMIEALNRKDWLQFIAEKQMVVEGELEEDGL